MLSFSPPTIFITPFFFFIIITTIISVETVPCHPDDEAGLLAFKAGITSDPSGLLNTWKAGTACCNWDSIDCSYSRVTTINIIGNSSDPNSILSGTISPSLSKLQSLTGIGIRNFPNITGTFPMFLFKLPNLMYIYLDNNGLSGPIPKNISKITHLKTLTMKGNRFSGHIPISIGNLTDLGALRLDGNLLNGPIPDSIRYLKNLTLLELNNNQLTGDIPDIFSDLTFLGSIKLSHNKFTGKIPKSIGALAESLETLEIGNNNLTGEIPDFIGNLTYLGELDLSSNQFTGAVPKNFSNLIHLVSLNLSHNSFVDPFSAPKSKALFTVDLSYNKYRLGRLPDWVRLGIFENLRLAKCGLKFNMDDFDKMRMGLCRNIDISENEITGNPLKLLNRGEYVQSFLASNNKMKFNLESIKFSEKLKVLDLSRNLIYGKVPKIVSRLQNLNVSWNNLYGELPSETKFPASAFAGNHCLCGNPLLPCKS